MPNAASVSEKMRHLELLEKRVVARSHMPFLSFKRVSQATSGPGVVSRLRPNVATYIVGDIHGRFDLLEELLRIIDEDVLAGAYDDPKLVFVGDYIDRGEQCAEVIDCLYHLTMDWPDNVTCLMGNHEAMLLSFLDNPLENGRRWFRYGGLQTLASYGIAMTGGAEAPAPGDLLNAAAQLRERLGSALGWLRDLPLTWQSRNLWVVHGAADPREAMEKQSRQTLLWGHSEFGRVRRKDGQWIAHGHTIVERARTSEGVISVDTGAVYSGRLSAAAVRPDGEIVFLVAEAGGLGGA